MLVYPSRSSLSHPHTLNSPTTTPLGYQPRPRSRQSTTTHRPRQAAQSLQKQAALNASLRRLELENLAKREEQANLEKEIKAKEGERVRELGREWEAEENQDVSIIVTSWDDERKCWFPVEAFGPVGRELRLFVERRRRALRDREEGLLRKGGDGGQ